MKRKTLASLGIIAVLAAVIVIKNVRFGSDVPELEVWNEPADELTVKGSGYSLKLVMKDNRWLVNDEGYPGDMEFIGRMEKSARDFRLVDLVSEKGYLEKYDLADDRALVVTVKGKGKFFEQYI